MTPLEHFRELPAGTILMSHKGTFIKMAENLQHHLFGTELLNKRDGKVVCFTDLVPLAMSLADFHSQFIIAG